MSETRPELSFGFDFTWTCVDEPNQGSLLFFFDSVAVGVNMDQQSADPNLLKNKHECRNTQISTQVKWRLPNKARLLTPGSEWPRSPPEYTPCTLNLAQIHKRTPTPAELKTFIWQHQLTPDTHTVLPWPCSTPGLIKIVAGIRGVATTGRQSHSFCALPVCFSVCVSTCCRVNETSQRLREGRSGEALTLSILHYWLVSRETVPSGQRQIE